MTQPCMTQTKYTVHLLIHITIQGKVLVNKIVRTLVTTELADYQFTTLITTRTETKGH